MLQEGPGPDLHLPRLLRSANGNGQTSALLAGEGKQQRAAWGGSGCLHCLCVVLGCCKMRCGAEVTLVAPFSLGSCKVQAGILSEHKGLT